MKKIKVKDNMEDTMFLVITKLLSNRKDSAKIIENALKNGKGKELVFDIDLKINGREFDFEQFMNELISREDEIVEKRVKEILEDKFIDINNKVNDILDDLNYISININEEE